MLFPIDLPPGQYRNGTEYQAAGRWRDGNLVRWREGAMQPVGGWRVRGNGSVAEFPRGMHGWRDNDGNRWIAAGSHDKLNVMRIDGDIFDITPAGLQVGRVDASLNTGYGGGVYGSGTYGTPTEPSGILQGATTWRLDNWGENLIACSDEDGRIYEWALDTESDAVVLSNAPEDCTSAFVTEERFLFALGAGGNPRKVQWSDRENNNEWSPQATNEAGDIELQTNGRVMQGVRARGQSVILTDTDAHTATYLPGSVFVYGFERVGTSCGAISRHAAAVVDDGVFWMGRGAFFTYQGGNVGSVNCEVSDYVFRRLNTAQESKVFAVANPEFNEIWWFYPHGLECDEYVALNYREGFWMTGKLDRTTGISGGIFAQPIWANAGGVLYDHDIGINQGLAFAETGPIDVQNGDFTFSAMKLIPDELTQGDVRAVFKTRFYPNGDETQHGPYQMAAPTNVRFSGRQVRLRVETDKISDWRVGRMRLQINRRGRR